MLNWLKFNKNYPDFWKRYLENIDKKSNRFVVLTTETSGYDANKDTILSLGAITVQNDKIVVGDTFEMVIKQSESTENNAENEADFLKNENEVSEPFAIEAFVDFVSNATLIGHRIDFDIEIINVALKKMSCGELKNEALDLEVMFRKWKNISDDKNIEIKSILKTFEVEKVDRNCTILDAYDLAIVFLKLKLKLGF